MRCGFVGLGQMGAPMAANLARSHSVVAADIRPDAVETARSMGLAIGGNASDFADCDVLVLCLPRAEYIERYLFGEMAIAARLKPGAVVVDTGTTDYSATLALAKRLDEMGLKFLDAPISGMRKRAIEGSLTMMVGGETEVLDAVRPALDAMASMVLHMGGLGAGQLTKLINQLLFDINVAALAEMLPLACLLGLDPEKTADVINTGTGRSYASEFFLPHILAGEFQNGYPLSAAYKDIVSGAEVCARNKVPAPVLAAASVTYQQALREGHGALDKGAMVLVYERLLGVKFRNSRSDGTAGG